MWHKSIVILLALSLSLSACFANRSKHGDSESPRFTYISHTVKYPGETLAAISAWYTGSAKNWGEILKHNPGLKVNRIALGSVIQVPDHLLVRREELPKKFLSQGGKPDFSKSVDKQSSPKKGANSADSDKANTQPNDSPYLPLSAIETLESNSTDGTASNLKTGDLNKSEVVKENKEVRKGEAKAGEIKVGQELKNIAAEEKPVMPARPVQPASTPFASATTPQPAASIAILDGKSVVDKEIAVEAPAAKNTFSLPDPDLKDLADNKPAAIDVPSARVSPVAAVPTEPKNPKTKSRDELLDELLEE